MKLRLISIFAVLLFLTNCENNEFTVLMDKDKLFLQKASVKKEIKFINDRWSLSNEIDNKIIWSPVFTPFEVKYNNDFKFIFTTNGKIFWVSNDKTSVKEVKFIDGVWKFQSEITDEWLSFDTLID